jgi:hypothetical protein
MTTINKEIKLLPFAIPTEISCCYSDREAETFIMKLKSLTEDEVNAYAMMIHNEVLKQWNKEKEKPYALNRINDDLLEKLRTNDANPPYTTPWPKTIGMKYPGSVNIDKNI